MRSEMQEEQLLLHSYRDEYIPSMLPDFLKMFFSTASDMFAFDFYNYVYV